MKSDHYFPLFEQLLYGRMNPFLPENAGSADFVIRLQEQVLTQPPDMGRYRLTFGSWTHPKAVYYQRVLWGETIAYCNDLIACLQAEENTKIRAYCREVILDRHLTACLQRLGELIRERGLKLSSLTTAAPDDTPDHLANCYVMHLLKVCVAKAWLEVQAALADVVVLKQSEAMLYAAFVQELPPLKTFLIERTADAYSNPLMSAGSDNQRPEAPQVVAPLQEYLLVSEVAAQLKVSEKTVIRRLKSGELKGKQDKRRWLIERGSL